MLDPSIVMSATHRFKPNNRVVSLRGVSVKREVGVVSVATSRNQSHDASAGAPHHSLSVGFAAPRVPAGLRRSHQTAENPNDAQNPTVRRKLEARASQPYPDQSAICSRGRTWVIAQLHPGRTAEQLSRLASESPSEPSELHQA